MNTYQTADFYLSSFLVANSLPLAGHSRDLGKVTFEFPQTEETKKLINEFYELRGSVEPNSFSSAIKYLKKVIYDYKPKYKENKECYTTQESLMN
ncbi:MAG: hypothetical protein CL946_00005 [Ectothiorhodospiraceae bacterium]|nr:hypothetical protein [Ectothiorhodospiraceae bacterium]